MFENVDGRMDDGSRSTGILIAHLEAFGSGELKTSKSGILEMLLSWYILSLKPKGKGDCKNLIHFMSLYIF